MLQLSYNIFSYGFGDFKKKIENITRPVKITFYHLQDKRVTKTR